MICPVCDYDMIVIEYRNIELDYCTNCKGVWFDSGELELLLESHGLEETKVFLDSIIHSPEVTSSEKKRNCPICGRKMKKTALVRQPEIIIDICRDEHGLWFDGGEVTQLMRHLTGEHPPKPDSRERVVGFLEEVFEAPEQKKDEA
jgi:Zn-finger nucleic acid-binding protein